jgi:DUF4097 and DUF4098 domain-containing protein YvlB
MKLKTEFTKESRPFLIFLFMLAAFMLSCSLGLYAGDLRVLQERSFQTQFWKSLYLNSSTGDVSITTWDKQEVYIKISGNKKAAEKMKFRLESENDGIHITAKRSSWMNWFFFGNLDVRFEIKVPTNYNVYTNTSGGDIRLNGLSGNLKLETSGGDISLINTKCKSTLSTSGGDITIDNNTGDIKLSTSGGDVKVNSFKGNLNASTSGGDMHLSGKGGEVHASTSGGDIYLNFQESNQGIYLGTTGGDIIVRVPLNFSAFADLSTTGGDVTCDIPITHNGKMTASKIKGDLNGGGKPLRCSTTGGDIKISKL